MNDNRTEYVVTYLNSKGLPVREWLWAADPDQICHDWKESYGDSRIIRHIHQAQQESK